MVARTKSTIACLAGPSFHDGSGSARRAVCAGADAEKIGTDEGRQQRQACEQRAAVDAGGSSSWFMSNSSAGLSGRSMREGRMGSSSAMEAFSTAGLRRRVRGAGLGRPPCSCQRSVRPGFRVLDLLHHLIEVVARRVLHRRELLVGSQAPSATAPGRLAACSNRRCRRWTESRLRHPNQGVSCIVSQSRSRRDRA